MEFVWHVIRSHGAEVTRTQQLELVKKAINALSQRAWGEIAGQRVTGGAKKPASKAGRANASAAAAEARYGGTSSGSGSKERRVPPPAPPAP
eukprot:12711949-Alexandrium_andersonii.AAC.1